MKTKNYRLFFIGFFLCFAGLNLNAKDYQQTLDVDTSKVYLVVNTKPEYPGGDSALMVFLRENLKYPEVAKKSELQGRVFVSFVVERDGSVSNVRVLRDIGGGCGEAAMDVVKKMPKWIPGKEEGIPVRVQYNLPVRFVLEASENAQEESISSKELKEGYHSVVANIDTSIFLKADEEPEFPGGEAGLIEYISKNLKYPWDAKKNRIEGRVFISFVVERDGSVSNIRVLRDIGGGCGEAGVDVIKNMPKWKPGKMNGKLVRVQYNLPLVFTLESE